MGMAMIKASQVPGGKEVIEGFAAKLQSLRGMFK